MGVFWETPLPLNKNLIHQKTLLMPIMATCQGIIQEGVFLNRGGGIPGLYPPLLSPILLCYTPPFPLSLPDTPFVLRCHGMKGVVLQH